MIYIRYNIQILTVYTLYYYTFININVDNFYVYARTPGRRYVFKYVDTETYFFYGEWGGGHRTGRVAFFLIGRRYLLIFGFIIFCLIIKKMPI